MKKIIIALFSLILLAVPSVALAEECPLCDAAIDGNLSEVKRLLDKGENVNHEKYGLTALMYAAQRGHSEVVKVLLDNEADANHGNEDGMTALMLVARAGTNQSGIMKILLDNGANVNHNDIGGWTALMIAADNGQSEVAKVLLDNGANVNHKIKSGMTALMLAAWDGHSEIAKALLDNGANVNDKRGNSIGSTALMYAAEHGRREIVKLLLECGANLDITNEYDKNALDFAKGKPILSAILKKHINDVVHGGKTFLSCDKTAAN